MDGKPYDVGGTDVGKVVHVFCEADAEEVVQEDGDESVYEEAGEETTPLAKSGGFSVVQGGV